MANILGIKFLETSARNEVNVEKVLVTIVEEIKRRAE